MTEHASRITHHDSVPVLNITGNRVALGPLPREIIPAFLRWLNDVRTLRTAGVDLRPRTLEDGERWYDAATTDETRATFGIWAIGGQEWVGFCGLRDIDDYHGTAEYAIVIGASSARGRGYGTEATTLILRYAFETRGLHTVLLTTDGYNLAGQRAYEKAGFRHIGRRRDVIPLNGQLYDEVFMAAYATT